MVIPTYSVSFSTIACKYFSKWRLKNIGGWLPPPPYPSTLTAYPIPIFGGTLDFFFTKMSAKDVKTTTQRLRAGFFCVFMQQKNFDRGGWQPPPPPLVVYVTKMRQ